MQEVESARGEVSPAPGGFVDRLLRIPLFYKILLANAVIVAGAVAVATWLTATSVERTSGGSTVQLLILLAGGGIAVSLAVNAVIVRLALRPLRRLEETAARIGRGESGVRAPASSLADREMERLRGTFNGMLDRLEAFRDRLRGVAARALRSAEEERKRIARELHDDTAQRLVALHMRLQMLRRSDDPVALRSGLDEVAEELRTTLEDLRRFARGLRPPALDELGLVPALRSHARSREEARGVPISVEGETGVELGEEEELVAYRIVQEAVTNALKHADPEEIRIRIGESSDGSLLVTVEDDGRGFSVEGVTGGRGEGPGLGLFGMRERAAYVGGSVEVESEPGAGTRVSLRIPGGRGA